MSATRTLRDRPKANAAVTGLNGKAGLLGTLTAVLIAMQDRHRQRCHLRGLDDRLLEDVGLSRWDVERETGTPFRRP